MTEKTAAPAQTKTTEASATKVRWDTSNLKSSYSNVCNATSTREEVVLNFGINEAWERGQKGIDVHLAHRIILSPFAAKRLSELLSKLIAEYEAKHGELRM